MRWLKNSKTPHLRSKLQLCSADLPQPVSPKNSTVLCGIIKTTPFIAKQKTKNYDILKSSLQQ